MAVTEQRVLPPEFIEALGKTYAEQLTTDVGGLRSLDVSKLYGPQFVSGPGALQTQAEQLATGLGGYQPYLQAAQAATGPTAYQSYMSPYQQDVISTALKEYDIQAQKGAQAIPAAAIQAGAFGGGREGIQRAEYQATSDRNRAALQAQLLQQGFGQAQQAAQQQFINQTALAQQTPALLGQQISALSALGTQQQGQQQAQLQAQRELEYEKAYQPFKATQQLGSGVMGLMGGMGQNIQTITPSPSPLSSALGIASTLAGIYGKLNPKG